MISELEQGLQVALPYQNRSASTITQMKIER